MWKKKPDNWSRISKDREELPFIKDLTASLLHSSSLWGRPHAFSLSAHLWLASLLTNCFSVYSPPWAVSIIINFVPGFIAFAS